MAEKLKPVDIESWQPRTELGRMVKGGEITTIEEIFERGKRILEPEIVDALLPSLESETLSVRVTQRVTDSGKRNSFRVVVVIGDRKGHVGVGVGKSVELRPALQYAIRDAKKNIIFVPMGCGSWECQCGQEHSIRRKTEGKEGSTRVVLKPAPRGLGLAGNDVVKKVLGLAGVKDIWSHTYNSGGNIYNMAVATIKALDALNNIKPYEE